MTTGWKSAIHERDGNKCKICGSIYHLTVQHKKAKCHGGKSTPDNCVTWCMRCHRAFHDRYGVATSDDYGNPVNEAYRPRITKPKHHGRKHVRRQH